MASFSDVADIKIASGGGRMTTTMDRYEADWDMVKRGWETHVLGEGPFFSSAEEAIQAGYDHDNVNDQYISPFVIAEDGRPVGRIQDGDAVLFFNFRGDRAIEICQAFESDSFDKFDRKRVPDVFFSGMMQYDGDQQLPKNFCVDPPQIDSPFSTYLCDAGLKSFAISETQKYGHVTYFWNGNMTGYIDESLETYIEIPSDPRPFHKQPEMQAVAITDKTIQLLKTQHYDFARVNFPNGDMIGHTGDFDATVKSVEITDECVSKIVDCVTALDGITVVCADHGNADDMFSVNSEGLRVPKTAHTLNPVPFAIIDSGRDAYYSLSSIRSAGLANVAATLFNLLGYEAPCDYEPSLIVPNSV